MPAVGFCVVTVPRTLSERVTRKPLRVRRWSRFHFWKWMELWRCVEP
jgi:hypothetical protein